MCIPFASSGNHEFRDANRASRAGQLNRDAGYWQWTWRVSRGERRDERYLSRCIQIARVITRPCCTWHTVRRERLCCTCAGRRGDSAGVDKMRHDERPRFYLAACQPVPPRRKFRTASPGMSVNWGTRAPMIALSGYREARCWTLREDRLHYIFVEECCSAFFSRSRRFRTRDARRDGRLNFFAAWHCLSHSISEAIRVRFQAKRWDNEEIKVCRCVPIVKLETVKCLFRCFCNRKLLTAQNTWINTYMR